MRAAEYTGNEKVTVGDRVATPPAADEVQIAVAYTGLCGTDLHILHGNMDARVTTPLTFGHEMSGIVDVLGDDVEGWSRGDQVTVMPLKWDGTCSACVAGHAHICHHLEFVGIDSPGSLQQRWNVRADLLVPLPAGLSLKHAALAEPTAVAVHDVRRGGVASGDAVVVLGGGPIGVLIAEVARHVGARVAVVELERERRDLIRALGFDAVDPVGTNVESWVETWTGGAGADVVFEVAGAAAAVAAATGLCKVRGTLVVVAIHPEPRAVDLKQVFWRELHLVGARVYERSDFEHAVQLLAAGVIPCDTLITRTVSLDELSEAFDDLEHARAMKILVDLGSES